MCQTDPRLHLKSKQQQVSRLQAVKFFSENHLHFPPPTTARIGCGLSRLKPLQGYVGSVVPMWLPQWRNFQTPDQGRSGVVGAGIKSEEAIPSGLGKSEGVTTSLRGG